MMRKFIFNIIVLITISGNNYGQENQSDFLVMGVPQYLAIEGLRIDIDYKTKKESNWITISPIVLLNNNGGNFGMNTDFESVIGGGLGITFKQYLLRKPGPTGAYFAYGPLYQYSKVEKEGSYWSERGEYSYEVEGKYNTQIHKIGGNCIIGNQMKIYDNLYADIYVGFGIRYSLLMYEDENNQGSYYNERTYDYGYSGILFVSGLRIGVGL